MVYGIGCRIDTLKFFATICAEQLQLRAHLNTSPGVPLCELAVREPLLETRLEGTTVDTKNPA